MHSIGETLIYGGYCLCTVADIRKESFGSREKKLYYVLKPIHEKGTTVYHPVQEDESKLTALIDRETARCFLESGTREYVEWSGIDAVRKEYFEGIIKQRDYGMIFALINTILQKKTEKKEQGKKLRASDERILADAEKLIADEFSFVLGISGDEIIEKLRNR